jgi:hypothetical protein
MLAWYIVAQFIAPTDAGVASERGVAAETAPRRGSPPAGERVPARGDR